MFKIDLSDSYLWPVEVRLPIDGGQFETHTFDAKFKRMTRTRLQQLKDDMFADKITDYDLAREVLIGWAGITQADADLAFSETMRDRILDVPGVANAIVQSFFKSLSGSKEKN